MRENKEKKGSSIFATIHNLIVVIQIRVAENISFKVFKLHRNISLENSLYFTKITRQFLRSHLLLIFEEPAIIFIKSMVIKT